jgi:hypothetical protein
VFLDILRDLLKNTLMAPLREVYGSPEKLGFGRNVQISKD